MIYQYRIDELSTTDRVYEEKRISEKYEKVVENYRTSFAKYDCEVETQKNWIAEKNRGILCRSLQYNDYVFVFSYYVKHNGIPIVYDDEGSELSKSYIAISLSQKGSKLKKKPVFTVYDDIEDIELDLLEDLRLVMRLFETSK
jgi:hypothetical protein